MTEQMKALWAERSLREQWMLGVMFALLAAVIFWFGIVMPLDRGTRASREALSAATDRHSAILSAVKQLKTLPRSVATDAAVPLEQLVSQSAGEAGLTLERAQAQGPERMQIAIATVRPIALFSWIGSLEAQGVRVDTVSIRPSDTAGSLAVQAILVRNVQP